MTLEERKAKAHKVLDELLDLREKLHEVKRQFVTLRRSLWNLIDVDTKGHHG